MTPTTEHPRYQPPARKAELDAIFFRDWLRFISLEGHFSEAKELLSSDQIYNPYSLEQGTSHPQKLKIQPLQASLFSDVTNQDLQDEALLDSLFSSPPLLLEQLKTIEQTPYDEQLHLQKAEEQFAIIAHHSYYIVPSEYSVFFSMQDIKSSALPLRQALSLDLLLNHWDDLGTKQQWSPTEWQHLLFLTLCFQIDFNFGLLVTSEDQWLADQDVKLIQGMHEHLAKTSHRLCQFFIQKGANPNMLYPTSLDEHDLASDSLLGIAIRAEWVELTDYLLRSGADPYYLDDQDQCSIDYSFSSMEPPQSQQNCHDLFGLLYPYFEHLKDPNLQHFREEDDFEEFLAHYEQNILLQKTLSTSSIDLQTPRPYRSKRL